MGLSDGSMKRWTRLGNRSSLGPAEPWRREGLAARQLWAEYIGSNTGLVFQEVREKRGLAYSAKAGVQAGWRVGDEDLVWATVGCRPEVAAQVAQLLLQLLRRQPDDVDRFERVRESVTTRVRSDRITFRSVGWTVERWRLRGLPPDPREALRQELETTPLEALRAFARTVAVIPATVWVVGDPTRIDLPALEAVAPTEEVTLDAICV